MEEVRVVTVNGPVIGERHSGFDRFLGIPYALPPVRHHRFRAPEPPENWKEPRLATSFAPHAPQTDSAMEAFMNGSDAVQYDESGCLCLNVWTPKADRQSRPVMVWVHGGGFVWGSASSGWYDGASFAREHDVVLVSFNYRLGVLGFTYLGDRGGPEFSGSGCLGVQDAAAVLRWVQVNIAKFGGDPRNVTIFGESAGAMSVGTLLAMPETTGLFHRAILQSGAASHVIDTAEAARRTKELFDILGSPEMSLDELIEIETRTLLEAHATLASRHRDNGLISVPVVDGDIVTQRPLDAVRSGSVADVELLIGTNLDEWLLFAIGDPDFSTTSEEEMRRRIGALTSRDVDDIVATYRERLGEATPARLLACAMTDSLFRAPAIALAEAQREAGGAVWMYLFEWASPQLGAVMGSCHALELPFVFNTADLATAGTFLGEEPPLQLARDVHATWAAFARHGDPSRGHLGEWPPYDAPRRATKIINETCRVEDDPLRAERELWQ